jgi:hypothetical protein
VSSGAAGMPILGCPPSAPFNGSSCAMDGQACSYRYCNGLGVQRFVCSGRLWVGEFPAPCDPSPQGCPSFEPVPGTPCSGSRFPPCSYSVCCGHTYDCIGGAWQHADRSSDGGTCFTPPPACPAQLPRTGDPCCFSAPLDTTCSYGCDAGAFASMARCAGNQWYAMPTSACAGPIDASRPVEAGPRPREAGTTDAFFPDRVVDGD